MNVLDLITGPIFKIIDKLIPDPAAKAAAQLKVLELNQNGDLKELDADLQVALAQAAINKAEADSPGLYKGGWRPGAGWVSVAGLGYTFLLQPLFAWYSGIMGWPAPPVLNVAELLTLLGGMLGLGTLRTVEKHNNVD
jgi:hypothetical protein